MVLDATYEILFLPTIYYIYSLCVWYMFVIDFVVLFGMADNHGPHDGPLTLKYTINLVYWKLYV